MALGTKMNAQKAFFAEFFMDFDVALQINHRNQDIFNNDKHSLFYGDAILLIIARKSSFLRNYLP